MAKYRILLEVYWVGKWENIYKEKKKYIYRERGKWTCKYRAHRSDKTTTLIEDK